MSSTAIWESETLESVPESDEKSEPSSALGNIALLKELVHRLLCELQCVAEVSTLNIGAGFDFYDEVSRFEIDLIKRALLQTGGHQVQAAKLLNLKVTTLNSKIKHYQINPNGFADIYPLVEPLTMEDHQPA